MRHLRNFLTSLLLLLLFCSPSFEFSASAVSDFVAACDVSGDGVVNSGDARTLLRVSARLQDLKLTEEAEKLSLICFGDMDGDGAVRSSDARLLLRYAARLAGEEDFKILREEPTAPPTTVPPTTEEPIIVPSGPNDPPSTTDEPTTVPPEATTEPLNTEPPATEPPTTLPGFNPETLEENFLLSPKEDHGLGQAKMAIGKAEYAMMTPEDQSNMRYTPLLNPYIKGTIDYVKKSDRISGQDVYILTSGERIETKDAEYLSSGFVLPSNTVNMEGVQYTREETAIWLKPLWQVPIRVQFHPQKYFNGGENRPYYLSEFTAEYVELTFYHTSEMSGEFVFPQGSVFRSAEWESSGDNLVLRLYLTEKGAFYGYRLEMTEKGYFRFSAKNKSSGLEGKTIVLDAGHGGSDPGGGSNGVYEAGINLKTIQYLKSMLEDAGAKVILTRSDDSDVSLNERVAITRQNHADLFISVHCDTADSTSASGVSVYYYYPFSMPFAGSLQKALVQAYQEKVYAPSDANYTGIDRGVKFYPFQVARVEECPAVLIELGFLTNAAERQILQKDATQKALAEGIFQGISEYFS